MDTKAITFHYPPQWAGDRARPRVQDHVIDIRDGPPAADASRDRKGERQGGSATRMRLTARAVRINQHQQDLNALRAGYVPTPFRNRMTVLSGVLGGAAVFSSFAAVGTGHMTVAVPLVAMAICCPFTAVVRLIADCEADDAARARAQRHTPELTRQISDLRAMQRVDTYRALLETRLPTDLVEHVLTFLPPARPSGGPATAPPA
ncbi:MAG: hypothetical protein ACOVK6_06235 [Ramlibacter sp.]